MNDAMLYETKAENKVNCKQFIRNRLHDGKCPECGKTLDGVGV